MEPPEDPTLEAIKREIIEANKNLRSAIDLERRHREILDVVAAQWPDSCPAPPAGDLPSVIAAKAALAEVSRRYFEYLAQKNPPKNCVVSTEDVRR